MMSAVLLEQRHAVYRLRRLTVYRVFKTSYEVQYLARRQSI